MELWIKDNSTYVVHVYQGIINCKGTETRQMFVMAKKIRELFASTLNEITASVRCVYSIIGVH